MYVSMGLFGWDFTVMLAWNERWMYDMHLRRLGDLK